MPGTACSFVDKKPFKTCYYRIITYGEDEQENDGHIDYINVNDTLPPCTKDFVTTTMKDKGGIELSWTRCGCDLFAVRIYREEDGK